MRRLAIHAALVLLLVVSAVPAILGPAPAHRLVAAASVSSSASPRPSAPPPPTPGPTPAPPSVRRGAGATGPSPPPLGDALADAGSNRGPGSGAVVARHGRRPDDR